MLLLDAADCNGSWPHALGTALARRFRLITPEAPPEGVDPGEWLGAFLEGLGTPGIGVVAAERFCLPALVLALRDPQRITRLVLLPDGAADWWGVDGVVEPAGRLGKVALLVPSRGVGSAESVSMIHDFLDDGSGPSQGSSGRF